MQLDGELKQIQRDIELNKVRQQQQQPRAQKLANRRLCRSGV
jgi:hypothetical protein